MDHHDVLQAQDAPVSAPPRDEAADWRWLMSSPRGRRIVRNLLEVCGTHRTSFGNGNDATNFREGARNVGLVITDKVLRHAPTQYASMLSEKD